MNGSSKRGRLIGRCGERPNIREALIRAILARDRVKHRHLLKQ